MTQICIALGGNLGDVPTAFAGARETIHALSETRAGSSSKIYRTPPIGPPGQPDYYNAVISIHSRLKPLDLLDALQLIELAYGRVRKEHWGARTLDLDIACMENLIIDSDRLQVPHPLMHERQFVLRPLCDIEPTWHHPLLKESAAALLKTLLAHGEPALAKGVIW